MDPKYSVRWMAASTFLGRCFCVFLGLLTVCYIFSMILCCKSLQGWTWVALLSDS